MQIAIPLFTQFLAPIFNEILSEKRLVMEKQETMAA